MIFSLMLLPAILVKRSKYLFTGVTRYIKPLFPFLENDLDLAEIKEKPEEYLSMNLFSCLVYFLVFLFVFGLLFKSFELEPSYVLAALFSLFVTLYIFFQNIILPKRSVNLRIKNIERNLMPALEDMLVQLNSNVPLFDIMANISKGDYGEISKEFKKAVKDISAGESEVDVLNELARKNPSKFFRRAIWQIVNSTKSGTKIADAITDTIERLGEEQVTQIQSYGSSLSGLVVFYMLITVVIPTLFITFFIVLSIFFTMTTFWTIMLLAIVYLMILFFEIMFLGIIRIRRPNLI